MPKYHSAIVYTDDPKDWAEYLRKPSQEEIDELCQGIAQAEQDGMFDGLFTGECRQSAELPTKQMLLDSISHDMKLYKSTFLKIYGYEISYPGFAELALQKLEDVGCERARKYYEQFTTEYEQEYREKVKDVSGWYQKKLDDEWERKVREYARREGKELREQKTIQNLTEKELNELYESLWQQGIITSPEQFVMVLEELGL